MTALRRMNIPIYLIYLPTGAELRSKPADFRDGLRREDRRLLESLERLAGSTTYFLPPPATRSSEAFDLDPLDWHPNRRGLQYYADGVADRLKDSVGAVQRRKSPAAPAS